MKYPVKLLAWGLLLVSATLQAQQDEEAMARARQHMQNEDNMLQYLVMGERIERHSGSGRDELVWEAQGWVGRDINKLWLKTEGHYDANESSTESAEIQALFSRAIAPFWDLQFGLRHDFRPQPERTHLVLGLQGLAPYWFEMDMAAFVSDEGNVSARMEAEYEMRFSQRLILQPRLEMNYSVDDDPAIALGQGFSKTELGLRLRYEVVREFAPYIGVAWERSFGATGQILSQAGEDRESLSFVAGIRFWY